MRNSRSYFDHSAFSVLALIVNEKGICSFPPFYINPHLTAHLSFAKSLSAQVLDRKGSTFAPYVELLPAKLSSFSIMTPVMFLYRIRQCRSEKDDTSDWRVRDSNNRNR